MGRAVPQECGDSIVRAGEFLSFANCGLPYHISGVIGKRESLLVATP